jgi:hypothetical protein
MDGWMDAWMDGWMDACWSGAIGLGRGALWIYFCIVLPSVPEIHEVYAAALLS